ncbi:sensor domain-containing diguanylate cyclase [Metabacillus litoralis]|uniref:sensor domain-containing diguanylate cyclase n=1 Tax=Metabacillus litoralis TaxID=152268 RepID=UPI001CFE7AFB|nr:sensor domain-containing diguanylate cyclase [Metabacillus litoralis]
MESRSVEQTIKYAFFNHLSEVEKKFSLYEVIEKLTNILKNVLSIHHAEYYQYNEKLNYLTPVNKLDLPSKSLPHSFIYGEVYQAEGISLIPIMQKDRLIGIVELTDLNENLSYKELTEIAKACSTFYSYCMNLVHVTQNDQKYEELYRITEKFHSLMDKDDVLVELISTLQAMYTEFIFYLFLSHDNENHRDLPIKELGFDYQEDNELAMEAYVTGKVKTLSQDNIKQTTVYCPLKGKQGVYGVLQVVANNDIELSKENKDFIVMLANTAGTALENAQLYDQSKRLIKDLQLINETSHRLNKSLRLTDTMTYMSSRIMESFDADEVGFFYLNQDGTIQIFPGSTEFFDSEDLHMYLDYIREKLEKDLEGLFIGDISTILEDAKYLSIMAVPMVQSDSLKGCALVMHKNPYHFSFDMFKLLQSLIHHSTLALTNSLLREELETLVKTDHLTQLYSRSYMNSCIEKSIKIDRQGTFLLIDIDNFKKVNDTFGHQIGDEILIQVANIINNNIREHDIGARWGGEELAVYLPLVELEAGIAIAERIVSRVRENTNPSITVSCGVSYWNADHEYTFDQLFKQADKALYDAKSKGKNQVIVQSDME